MILDYIIILILILDCIYDFSAFLIFICTVFCKFCIFLSYVFLYHKLYDALLYKGIETFWSVLRNKLLVLLLLLLLLLLLSAANLMRDLILVTIVIVLVCFRETFQSVAKKISALWSSCFEVYSSSASKCQSSQFVKQ